MVVPAGVQGGFEKLLQLGERFVAAVDADGAAGD
jgi:hypothetical protein